MNYKALSKSFALAITTVSLNLYANPSAPLEKYVVLIKPQAGSPARVAAEAANRTAGKIGYVYSNGFKGFSISLPAAAVKNLKADKRFSVIAPDVEMSAIATTSPTGHAFVGAENVTFVDATDNTKQVLINQKDDYRVLGRVAVLDTGIDHNHVLLNVFESVDCMVKTSKGAAWSASYTCESGTGRGMDGNGHGTHVAGTIGALDTVVSTSDGTDYHLPGIATGVELVAVKVLDDRGSGYVSTILAGLDWVAGRNSLDTTIHAVNMSLGGTTTSIDTFNAYKTVIDAVTISGATVVVAAGNESELLRSDDAVYSIPAEVPNAVTVAALNASHDGIASFSNYGDVVDIYAPGTNVLSTYTGNQIATLSGTSMASPYVAGAVALMAANGGWQISNASAESSPIPGFKTLNVGNLVTSVKVPDTTGSNNENNGGSSPSNGRGKKK